MDLSDNVKIVERGGKKIVEIDTILFSGKQQIDWNSIERYLKKYIGKSYILDELDELVYIEKDFPLLIKTATNIAYQENREAKHNQNAKYGWYRCTVRFTLPISDDKGKVIGQNTFQGRMIIRFAENGKKYLYDIIDIKKET